MNSPTPRATLRRADQREALIMLAERKIAEEGAANLRARDLAKEIGMALGAIYNLVADMQDLIWLVAGRTMDRMDLVLSAAAEAEGENRPAEQLKAVALAYLNFARANFKLWRSVFEDGPPEQTDLPDWIIAQKVRLFRHIQQPLDRLAPHWNAQERQLFAHTLFTAAHGVIMFGLEQRLIAVPPDAIAGQLDLLVDALTVGLGTRR